MATEEKETMSKEGVSEENLAEETPPGSSWPLETIHSEEESKSLEVVDSGDIASVESSGMDQPAAMASPRAVQRGVATVTSERKQELLLQARADRLRWIQKVPLPYLNAGSLDPLENFLKNSHASITLPSVSGVLYLLYGDDTTGNANELLRPDTLSSDNTNSVYLTGYQILSSEIDATEDDEIKDILKSYKQFLKRLEDPSSNILVQGTRTFCRNFADFSDREAASSQLQSYLKSAKVPEEMKFCFEAFVYGHCRETIERIAKRTDDEVKEDADFEDKLESLSFVNPTHLDITIDESLLPVGALQSVDKFHSIYDKLRMILKMYKGVNEALKKASDSLPSADDVLPGIIYTVLKAKASRLSWNLNLIEHWAPQEYLRGEAGYAFTNLYGAVQFLRDIKDSSSLTISDADFTEKIAECRSKAEERMKLRAPLVVPKDNSSNKPNDATPIRAPSASEIRRARKNGEIVNLEWAIAWQKSQKPVPNEETEEMVEPARRQYSFLGKQADDIRLVDLPSLLDEYRDLYQRNESYVAEKTKRASRAKRKIADDAERDLIATARALDLL